MLLAIGVKEGARRRQIQSQLRRPVGTRPGIAGDTPLDTIGPAGRISARSQVPTLTDEPRGIPAMPGHLCGPPPEHAAQSVYRGSGAKRRTTHGRPTPMLSQTSLITTLCRPRCRMRSSIRSLVRANTPGPVVVRLSELLLGDLTVRGCDRPADGVSARGVMAAERAGLWKNCGSEITDRGGQEGVFEIRVVCAGGCETAVVLVLTRR